MEDRYLNFNKFLKERAAEIMKFTSVLELDTRKRGHQSVPKSIRRRAMSHNRFRIPVKIRKPMQQDLIKGQSMQKLPKCRKHIRKRQRLITSYQNRHSKIKWLSTHVWSAKRMRMIKYYGYKIPYTPNEKCFRSSYRHFRHNACLMDFSYLQTLTISFTQIVPSNIKIDNKSEKLETHQLYEGYIYKNKDSQLICPILIVPQTQNKLHCFYHPSCRQQIEELMWDDTVNVQNTGSKSQIYLLLGPRSLQLISEGLQKCGVNLNTKLPQLGFSLKNKLNYFHQQKNKIQKKPLTTEPYIPQPKLGYDSSQNERLRKIFFQQMEIQQNTQTNENMSEEFWNFYKEGQNTHTNQVVFKITTRSKYTHRRGTKVSKKQKKQLLQSQKQEKKQAPKHKQKQKIQKQILVQQKTLPTQECIVDPFMIATFSKNSLFKGCLVFCSNRDNCRIWRSLSKTNIKLIGRQQYRHILLQSRIQTFPEDFPQTLSFADYNKERSMKLISKYRRLPFQKRPNYQKISSPFPYYFNRIDQLKSAKIEMVSRGRCFEGSYICKLQKQDYDVIEEMLNKNTVKSIISEQKIKGDKVLDYKKDSYEEINKKLSEINGKRQIIGFVTSGGFLYHKSRQGGLGYVRDNFQDEYALVRKPSSVHYFLAIVE